MLGKWKRGIDKRQYLSTLLISTAFDTINRDLMLTKLKAYGFSTNAVNLIHSYLKNRKQKVHINKKISLERDITAGVPQGSVDGTLLFNLFINGLVLIHSSLLSNHADDNNLFVTEKNKKDIKLLAKPFPLTCDLNGF